ncbi:MAG: GNAT family N-acetyltransferase [Flammeovirgaceae bacterium]|nr:GNAT family N-acetyltransferase [Flammeovirgaceae bacterium]
MTNTDTTNQELRLLSESDFPDLHQTFLDAFADYFVNVISTQQEFWDRLNRMGVDFGISAGAFHENKLVGFIINGKGFYNEKLTAYNAGTGVIPEFRGKKLTEKLYHFLFAKLKLENFNQCLLEVITKNQPALNVYQNLGFKITRTLHAFSSEKLKIIKVSNLNFKIEKLPSFEKIDFSFFNDFTPSWPNTLDAIHRNKAREKSVELWLDNKIIGFLSFSPASGRISQISVHRSYRGLGVGSALLMYLTEQTGQEYYSILNIDERCTGMQKFLLNSGFRNVISQYEMLVEI